MDLVDRTWIRSQIKYFATGGHPVPGGVRSVVDGHVAYTRIPTYEWSVGHLTELLGEAEESVRSAARGMSGVTIDSGGMFRLT